MKNPFNNKNTYWYKIFKPFVDSINKLIADDSKNSLVADEETITIDNKTIKSKIGKFEDEVFKINPYNLQGTVLGFEKNWRNIFSI